MYVRILTVWLLASTLLAIGSSEGLAQEVDGWRILEPLNQEGEVVYETTDGVLKAFVGPARADSPVAPQELLKTLVAERRALGKTLRLTEAPQLRDKSAFVSVTALVLENSDKPTRSIYYLVVTKRLGQHFQIFRIYPMGQPPDEKRANTDFEKLITDVVLMPPEAGVATAEGVGPEATDIRGVIHRFGKKRYDTFKGLWVYGEEVNWLIFNDGWAYKNPERPPSEIDIEASRASEPDRWARVGDHAQLEDLSGLMEPLEPGTLLDLEVGRPDVDGTTISSSVTKRGLVLRPDGTFETHISTLVFGGVGETATTVATSEDKDGRQSTINGQSGNVATVRTEKKAGSGDYSGRYEIDGLTIKLTFDSGRVARHLFATNGEDEAVLGERFYFE